MHTPHDHTKLDRFILECLGNAEADAPVPDWEEMNRRLGTPHQPVPFFFRRNRKFFFLSTGAVLLLAGGIFLFRKIDFSSSAIEPFHQQANQNALPSADSFLPAITDTVPVASASAQDSTPADTFLSAAEISENISLPAPPAVMNEKPITEPETKIIKEEKKQNKTKSFDTASVQSKADTVKKGSAVLVSSDTSEKPSDEKKNPETMISSDTVKAIVSPNENTKRKKEKKKKSDSSVTDKAIKNETAPVMEEKKDSLR